MRTKTYIYLAAILFLVACGSKTKETENKEEVKEEENQDNKNK